MDQLGKNKKGFLTIELMISIALMALVLSAVVMVSFSNQNFLVDSQTNAEALKIAQGLIEEQQALARKDFNLVNPVPLSYTDILDSDGCPSTFITDSIYQKKVCVITDPEKKGEYFNKLVTAVVEIKNGRNVKPIKLSATITNFNNAIGGDTCDSVLSGDWKDPKIESTINFSTLSGIPSGTYKLSNVDAYQGKLYVTANNTSGDTDPTFFIFDISDPSHPKLKGSIDNEGSSGGTTRSGLNAVKVSHDPATNKIYAYAANAYDADYSTCDPSTTPNCGELYIFDVTDYNDPQPKANLKLNSSPLITDKTYGSSIYYKNGYIFLGLASTEGPEFHIIDVHKPQDLVKALNISQLIKPTGSFETIDGINSIIMRGTYVYLATTNISNPQELQILDISNPESPNPGPTGNTYGFNATEGAGHGKNLYLIGDNLYFGKTGGAGADFHIFENIDPTGTLTPSGDGINIGSSNSVNKIIVRDYLSFLLTNSDLKIFKTDDTLVIPMPQWGLSYPLPGTYNSSYPEPSMDCEGNRLYISSNNENGQGYIYIIEPGK